MAINYIVQLQVKAVMNWKCVGTASSYHVFYSTWSATCTGVGWVCQYCNRLI